MTTAINRFLSPGVVSVVCPSAAVHTFFHCPGPSLQDHTHMNHALSTYSAKLIVFFRFARIARRWAGVHWVSGVGSSCCCNLCMLTCKSGLVLETEAPALLCRLFLPSFYRLLHPHHLDLILSLATMLPSALCCRDSCLAHLSTLSGHYPNMWLLFTSTSFTPSPMLHPFQRSSPHPLSCPVLALLIPFAVFHFRGVILSTHHLCLCSHVHNDILTDILAV